MPRFVSVGECMIEMSGGDGYTALSNGTVLIDKSAASLMASDVIDYITGMKTVSPAVEGRIVIKK